MYSFLKYVPVLLVVIYWNSLTAQNEYKQWYFGQFAGLSFNGNTPLAQTNATLFAEEACASISNNLGVLQFYTNGEKIMDASHQTMANGNNLAGEAALSQCVLIAQQPSNTSMYYVFTANRGAAGLRYSIVDMSLAAGMGSVTVKNVLLDSSSTLRVCGVKHCNGSDVWIISHDNFSNQFKAWLLTASGMSTLASVSAIGSVVSGKGCMKVSPNGKKLAQALANQYTYQLFDFDASSGFLSNKIDLPVSEAAYSCEFSPDGTKLYANIWGLSGSTNRLVQWDLCSLTATAIAATSTTFNATHTGQLQLAPNGSIYQARASIKRIQTSPESYIEMLSGESMLGVIYNPNASASNVFFNNSGQSVSPGLSLFGLPNVISGFYKSNSAQFSYSINPAVNCSKVFFMAPPLINATCSATSYTVSSVLWMFGDASAPNQNTSTLINPEHSYPGVGSYAVKLVRYNSCGGVIDTVSQMVQVGSALLNSPNSLTLCSGNSITLMASGPNSYTWSTGAIANSIVVSPTINTTYSLSFTDVFGCSYQSANTVTVFNTPNISVSGKDSLCETQSSTLTVSGALTYSWSTGSTNTFIKVTPNQTTTYNVLGYSIEGCSALKTKTVTVKLAPIPTITGNTVVCIGNMATVVAQGSDNIYWNNGAKGPTLTVVPDWNLGYVFSATAKYANGCSRFERVRFKIVTFPEVKLVGSNSLCVGSSITLSTQVIGSSLTYSWTNGANTATTEIKPNNSQSYSIVVTSTDNCSATDSIRIKVNPTLPENCKAFGNATICSGESAYLNAEGGAEFNWNPKPVRIAEGPMGVWVSPSSSTIYSVTISTDSACAQTRTVQVHVNPKPSLWLGNDTVFNLRQPMYLTAQSTGTVIWVKGEGIDCYTCARTQIFPTQRTLYQAKTINEFGCENNDEVLVDIGDELGIYVPNGFTPNYDGLNDELKVRGFGIVLLRFTVFNRWGQVVFTSTNADESWDGSSHGTSCAADTYTWLLEYRPENGTKAKKTGFVRLIR